LEKPVFLVKICVILKSILYDAKLVMSIRVVILEDHQPAIDGYYYRLSGDEGFEIVAAVAFAEELKSLLAVTAADILLLDVSVPTAEDNPAFYPTLSLVAELQELYPELKIVIISMHSERTLIQSALKVGVNGYILKEDRTAIQNLPHIMRSIANGGSYLSQQVLNQLSGKHEPPVTLSRRQLQILSTAAANPNLTQSEIADELHVAHSTVRNSLTSVYQRMDVRNLAGAITRARELGIIEPPASHSPYSAE
jgi:DNA-binding NarL/FixJ family response regulator